MNNFNEITIKEVKNKWSSIDSNFSRVGVFTFFKKNYKTVKLEHQNKLTQACIYICWGKDENNQQNIYIGQSKDSESRWNKHKHFDSQWCKQVIFFYSDKITKQYNKDQLDFFETELIKKIKKLSNNVKIHNKTSGNMPNINPDEHYMLQNQLNIFYDFCKKLNINLFENQLHQNIIIKESTNSNKIKITNNIDKTNQIKVEISVKGSVGYGVYFPDTNELKVLKGSKAQKELQAGMKNNNHKIKRFNEIKNQIVLKEDENYYHFLEDFTFDSPRSAETLFKGAIGCNGTAWRISSTHQKLIDFLKQQIK